MHALPHSVPWPCSRPLPTHAPANTRPHQRLLDTPRQVWVSLLWGPCSFLRGPGAQGSVCALQESVSPVLCKFWQLYDGVNGDFLQKGLCHTQVCCTQSLCPCSRPLLTLIRYKPNPGWIGIHLNGAFLVAQMVKNLLAMQETQIPPLGWEDTWRREYPLQYSCLENLMNNGAWWATVHGVTELDTTEWLTLMTSLSPQRPVSKTSHFLGPWRSGLEYEFWGDTVQTVAEGQGGWRSWQYLLRHLGDYPWIRRMEMRLFGS